MLFIEKKCESNFTNIPNPGIEPRPPTLQVNSLLAEPEGKPKNIGVGSLSLLQQIFLTQEWNWGLLPCRWILYQLSFQGSPIQWIASLNHPKDWRIWDSLCACEELNGPNQGWCHQISVLQRSFWLMWRQQIHSPDFLALFSHLFIHSMHIYWEPAMFRDWPRVHGNIPVGQWTDNNTKAKSVLNSL